MGQSCRSFAEIETVDGDDEDDDEDVDDEEVHDESSEGEGEGSEGSSKKSTVGLTFLNVMPKTLTLLLFR